MRKINLLACIAVVAIAFVAYQWFGTTPGSRAATAVPAMRPDTAAPQRVLVSLEFSAGKLIGPSTIKVEEGDVVRLDLTVDAADRLHLHGYDLELPLRAGEPARLEFTASRTGRFTYELHHADIELGALEVYPR
jgi:FtsP/CotA-like multicopper oxidase with cupredoxin domain